MSYSSCIQNAFLTGKFCTSWNSNDIIFMIEDNDNNDYDYTYLIVKTTNNVEVCRFEINKVVNMGGNFTFGYILHVTQKDHLFYICVGIQEDGEKYIENYVFDRDMVSLKNPEEGWVYETIWSEKYMISKLS